MPTTTSRLLGLLSLLQTRRDWPGSVLAERLGISHRTVRRDVDRLRELGYSIQAVMGPAGGYRLDAGSELPPLLFDDDQVVALAVALQAATSIGVGIGEPALRALTTVRQVLPSRLRHRVDAVEFSVVPRSGAAPVADTSPAVLTAISTAVRAREVLRFDYSSTDDRAASVAVGRASSRPFGSARAGSTDLGLADGREAGEVIGEPRPPRRVEPHGLVLSQGHWYLVAWDLDRDDWRIFRADRLRPRIPTGPRFTPREIPGGDPRVFVAARFTGADVGGASSSVGWPCVGSVVLHRPARDVEPFAGDGVVDELGPHRCRYTVGSWSWAALAASLGRFDADFDEVGPSELRAAFAALANRYSAAVGYTSGPTDTAGRADGPGPAADSQDSGGIQSG